MRSCGCAALALVLLLSGCAVAVKQPFADATATPRVLAWCIDATATPGGFARRHRDQPPPTEFSSRVADARAELQRTLTQRLAGLQPLHVDPLAACPRADAPEPVHADLLLRVDIAGYGNLQPRWKRWLIGTGIVEGVVQGAAVMAATHNGWLAAGVTIEEWLSEYLTWNGVDWFLGEAFAPVTLEATLVTPTDGRTLWRRTVFVRENSKELKGLPKPERANKTRQLQASLHRAEQRLSTRLDAYLRAQVLVI